MQKITALINGIQGEPFPTFTLRIENTLSLMTSFGFEVNFVRYEEYLANPWKTDFIIVQRFVSKEVESSLKLAQAIITKARSEQTIIIYDIDDNFEEMNYSMSAEFPGDLRIIELFKKSSNLVLVSTLSLQKSICSNIRTFVLPNYLKENPPLGKDFSEQSEIVLGYVGNFDRLPDIITVLIWFSENHQSKKKIVLDSLGISERTLSKLMELLPNIEFRNSATIEYSKLHQWISKRKWTASISPLSDSNFNASKSVIKVIDYSWNSAPMGISGVGEATELF